MEYLVGDKKISITDNSADCRVLKYVTHVKQSHVTVVYRIKRTKTLGQVNIFRTEYTSLVFWFNKLNKRHPLLIYNVCTTTTSSQ